MNKLIQTNPNFTEIAYLGFFGLAILLFIFLMILALTGFFAVIREQR